MRSLTADTATLAAMTLLALTGGIASGKSTIAAQLVAHGAVHIDADQLAREAVAVGSSGLAQIVSVFGPEMLGSAGELDRAQLGSRVFADSKLLQKLNSIVHPAVRQLADARIAQAIAQDSNAVIVYDVPLLVESGVTGDWDAVVVAEAPPELRLQRLVELRGMTPGEAQQRIDSQATNAQRRAVADRVIDTGGSLLETQRQVDALWQQLLAGEKLRTGTPGN